MLSISWINTDNHLILEIFASACVVVGMMTKTLIRRLI